MLHKPNMYVTIGKYTTKDLSGIFMSYCKVYFKWNTEWYFVIHGGVFSCILKTTTRAGHLAPTVIDGI